MSITLSRFLVFAAAAWLASSICVHGQQPKYYCAVPFYTGGATQTTYSEFIQNLRHEMGSQATIYGIPQLREAASWANADRYVQVILFNSAGTSITLAIDKVNVYLVGYRTGYEAYFFPGHGPEISNVFAGATRYWLPFNSSYSALERSAGTTRRSIYLGMGELDKAIQALYDHKQDSALASSLLIVIQMISDAVRYRYVEKLVLQHISNKFLPTPAMIAFEDNWKNLSNKITNSVGGVIYPPFILPSGSNQEVSITSVFITFRLNIGVIFFYCHPATAIPPVPSITCQNIPEPTVLIKGRDGFCVDVESNYFNDGNPIILYPFHPFEASSNQLWTIKRDGTIQSAGGKCLYAKGLTAGQNINLHNCSTAPVPDAIKWNINDNGNIENPKSGLVLSAFNGSILSVLTVEKNIYASSQGWRLGNSTKPVVTTIIGYQSLCMQASGSNTVQMVECSNTNVLWELYPDGTVRPNTATSSCLTSKSSQDAKTLVLDSCNGGDTDRWLFNYDYTISDAANKYVLEVNKVKNVVLLVEHSADTPTDKQTWSISTL